MRNAVIGTEREDERRRVAPLQLGDATALVNQSDVKGNFDIHLPVDGHNSRKGA